MTAAAAETSAPVQPLVLDVAFPCTLGAPRFGRARAYVADSPAKAAYVDALEAEIGSLDDDLRARPVKAVRLAGGASIMSCDKVAHLVRRIRKELAVEPRAQVSIEVEPITVGTPSLSDWTSCGVNRVELDVWSVVDGELAALGARHRREQVQNALLFLEKFHVNDVSARLLLGLPGQTAASWRESLEALAKIGCPHIEVLPLVETDPAKAAQLPDDAARRAFYEQSCELLGREGYVEYTVGSFALGDAPHARSAFGVARREGAGLLGLGAGAASDCDGFLYENTADFDRYVQNAADFEQIACNPRRAGDDLRQLCVARALFDAGEPIGADGLAARCGVDTLAAETVAWLDDQVNAGLLARDAADSYVPTAAGRWARLEELGSALTL